MEKAKSLKIYAVDPGPEKSAIAIWDGGRIHETSIMNNGDIVYNLKGNHNNGAKFDLVIERVACYGMPVGESIFETVYWSGRFAQAYDGMVFRVPRREVKMHLCGSMRAKDSNIIQALVDRFAPYKKNRGKGNKKNPGFFYGFKADIWQAFALAVTFFDNRGIKIK